MNVRWLRSGTRAIVAWCCLTASSLFAADTDPATLFRTGNYAESIDAAQKLMDDGAYSEQLRVLKIRGELELGRFEAAKTSLDAALVKFPSSVALRAIGRDVARFNRDNEQAAKFNDEIAALVKETAWRYGDVANQITLGRWMLSQGADPKKVLTSVYNEMKRRQPGVVDIHLAIGDLALDKHDYQLAGDAFQQAAKLEPENPDTWVGVAKAFASSDDEKTAAALAKAIAINPRHLESLLLMVDNRIDQEDYAAADKLLDQIAEINPHQPRALAYRAIAAHLRNKLDDEKKFRAAALAYWSENPAVDYLIGKKLSQKYRFAEGAAYQRRVLEIEPNYLPAKAQLAQDLLRLGREEEGLKLAEAVYEADAYNVFAHNLVTLQESLAKFRTLEADGILVRMDAREAEIYGARVLALLKRAKQTLAAKYEVDLPQPIIVELFPRQQDFAIRTFGLPGGRGFLGVCFGTVITANSPASQGTTPACWEATLWHEFCHVVTLNKTENKMPRWLSEGISVYEERQADPSWGQSMTPRYREMILGEELTPVSELSAAFLRPKSGAHLNFAYYESSLVVEYLIEKHGLDVLKRVLVDLSAGMPIQESLARYTGPPAALDDAFAKYAREQANALAPDGDWATPELPRRPNAEALREYLKEHPQNYAALSQFAARLVSEEKWPEAKETAEKLRTLYPADTSPGGGNALLAKIYRGLKENQREREVLETLAGLAADEVDVFDRLITLAAEAEDWRMLQKYVAKRLAVNPLLAEPHRRAALAAEKLHDDVAAEEAYRALLLLEPFDPAETHFRLASALMRQKKTAEAKRHVLLALEETPRFAAAQKLLLELVEGTSP